MRQLFSPKKAYLQATASWVLLAAASIASGQQAPAPADGLTLRGTAPFGAEAPVTWSLVSAKAAGGTLTVQLADEKGSPAGDLSISPWPRSRQLPGGLALGLPKQRIQPGAVKVTGSRTLQPFGPVQRLAVQARGSNAPVMVVQTRAQSGQLVVAGWRSVYADKRWVFQSDVLPANSSAPQPLDAMVVQRLRSQGRDWCVTSFARTESQESPPLLDWVLVAAPAKRRCPA